LRSELAVRDPARNAKLPGADNGNFTLAQFTVAQCDAADANPSIHH